MMRLESIEEGKDKIFIFGSREIIYCAEERRKALEIGRLTCLFIQMTSVGKRSLSFRIELSGDDER